MAEAPDKQAVVLIHGIGEQKPMDTLRGFVEAVWLSDESVKHTHAQANLWSKPDRVSDSFELRRLTTSKNRAGTRTDFFEFYWAHLMSGTKLQHVLAWARVLLLRWPWNVPKPLFGAWVLVVLLVLAVAFFVVNGSLPEDRRLLQIPLWGSLVLGAVGAGLSYLVLWYVGDAARYLHPAPTNIQRRHEIRSAGVDLLEKLHETGRYGRIVIVGHSLGSVIGYDILTHAWPDYDTRFDKPEGPQDEALKALEALAADGAGAEQLQPAQRAYLRELKAQNHRWLVTDFVTLGSPLTHAAVLLARDAQDLAQKQRDREFPTCPPVLEKGRFSYERSLEARRTGKEGQEIVERRRFDVPHHAAVFGPTRWTNLYFPAWLVFWGDLIAGPLAPFFGAGVRDVAVKTGLRGGLLSHTLYWKGVAKPAPAHIAALRAAVNLTDDPAERDDGAA